MPIQDIFAYTTSLKSEIENLSVESLKEELAQNPELLLIDIREIQEVVDLGTIPGAIHCPRGMLEFWASPASPYFRDYFQENRRTVVFCAGGGRSVLAVKSMEAMGFNDVAHLERGLAAGKRRAKPSKMRVKPAAGCESPRMLRERGISAGRIADENLRVESANCGGWSLA